MALRRDGMLIKIYSAWLCAIGYLHYFGYVMLVVLPQLLTQHHAAAWNNHFLRLVVVFLSNPVII